MTKRFRTVLHVVGAWVMVQVAAWALEAWLDANVTGPNVQAALTLLVDTLKYLGGDFGVGFVVGALLFSLWDWPFVGQWIRKQRERLRNKEADEALAQQCDEVSKFLYEQAATVERIRNDNFWATSMSDSRNDHETAWRDARAAEAREEERIRKHVGPKVQRILVSLKERNVNMDLWGLSLGAYDLARASFFFAESANSLREGTYLERKFSVSRDALPARM